MISSLKPVRLVFRAPSPSGSRTGSRAAVFLDRDGVINERIFGGFVTQWSEFRLVEDIVPVLRTLGGLRLPIIVVSNQSGVNRGVLGLASLRRITARFVNLFGRHQARIDAVYYCPHTDEDRCSCRKPKPGLLLAAARDYRIDLRRSVMIGDEPRDVDAAQAAGCQGIILGDAIAPGYVTVSRPNDLPGQVAKMLGRGGWLAAKN